MISNGPVCGRAIINNNNNNNNFIAIHIIHEDYSSDVEKYNMTQIDF